MKSGMIQGYRWAERIVRRAKPATRITQGEFSRGLDAALARRGIHKPTREELRERAFRRAQAHIAKSPRRQIAK